MKNVRVACIGSASEDVFIESKEFHFLRRSGEEEHADICLPFGKKLDIEKAEFGFGGGAMNSSIGFSRMGLKVSAVLNLGKDLTAQKIKQELKKERVSVKMVMQCGEMSGYSVILRKERGDRTILTYRGSNNCFEEKKIDWKELKKHNWFYISSFGSKDNLLEEIAEFAKKNKKKIAFNPGVSQRAKGINALGKILARTEIIIMNKAEALELAGEIEIGEAIKKLHKAGARIVAITQGKHKVIVSNGKKVFERMPFDVPVIEATGAGDAFSSGFVSAYIKGNSLEECMNLGIANACSVIQFVGTTKGLLSFEQAKNFVKKHSKPNQKEY